MGVGKSVPLWFWSRYFLYTLRVLYSTSPLDFALVDPLQHMDDDLADAPPVCTRKCPVPWSKLTSGITLSRGVGKTNKQANERRYCRCTVVVVFLAGSDESRYPGSSDESPGDWHSYTSEDARGEQKAHPVERS
jgi:hypothetical protein